MVSIPNLIKGSLFPLFGKELIEQSARKRTYVLRGLAAGLMFGWYVMVFLVETGGDITIQQRGIGAQLFRWTVLSQVVLCYLLTPILVGGTIAYERERQSMDLLKLTALSPWHIVLEKYLSRLMPMLSMLLIAMPLYGVSYMLGGLQADTIWDASLRLMLTAIQLSAGVVLCSALSRNTAQAVVACYIVYAASVLIMVSASSVDWVVQLMRSLFPMAYEGVDGGYVSPFWSILITVCLLLNAGEAIARSGSRFSLAPFLGWWQGGAFERSLPETSPVRWLESQRGHLRIAQPGARFEWFLILAALIMGVYLGHLQDSPNFNRDDDLFFLNLTMWGLAAVFIGVRCSGSFSEERAGGTLDVLLVSGLTPREIVQQKASVIGWYFRVFGRALFVLVVVRYAFYLRFEPKDVTSVHVRFLIHEGLMIYLYLHLAGWVSLLIGLRVSHRLRALGFMFALLVAWTMGPLVFFWLHQNTGIGLGGLAFMSPLFNVLIIEQPAGASYHFHRLELILYPIISAIGFWVILLQVRRVCLRSGELLLTQVSRSS